MAIDTVRGMDEVMYEFNGDALPSELNSNSNGTGSGVAVNPSVTTDLIDKAIRSSSVVLDTGTVDNGKAEVADGRPRRSPYNGRMVVESRIIANNDNDCNINAGMYSENAADDSTLPVSLTAGALAKGDASTGNDFVGFVYDADATSDNWHAAFIDDGSITGLPLASLDTGIAYEDGVWYTARVEITQSDTGKASAKLTLRSEGPRAYDTYWEGRYPGVVDNDVLLGMYVGAQAREVSNAQFVSVDYMCAESSRGV